MTPTRSCFYIFAAGLALAAVASAETVEEQSFAEATSFVQAFMANGKGGDSASESACRKVADDSMKTVVDECAALQKNIDDAAKATQPCCKSGKPAVCAAKSSQGKQDGKKTTCKGEAADIASSKIKVNVSMDRLKNGKCDAVFNSKDYKDKKKKMDDKNKECTKLKGAAKMAKKALKNAIDAAKKARKTCTRQAKTSLDAAFKSAKKVCSSKANKKSFTRAMHMKCVLDGKSISGCGKANPPTVTKTKASKLTCAATNADDC